MQGKNVLTRPTAAILCALAGSLALPAIAAAATEQEPNNTIQTAQGPLGDGVTIQGTRENGTAEDWFYFDVGGAQKVTVAFKNTTPSWACANRGDACFLRADLRDSHGDLMTTPTDPSNTHPDTSHISYVKGTTPGQTATLTWTVPAAGRYTIEVYTGATGDTYDLTATGTPALIGGSVTPPPPPPPPVNGGATGETPKTCAQLATDLGHLDVQRGAVSRLYSKANAAYAKAARTYKKSKTGHNKRKRSAALKRVIALQDQLEGIDSGIVDAVALLQKSSCSCELSTRLLSSYKAKLTRDAAALTRAKRAEKKATTRTTLRKWRRARAKLQANVRADSAKIKLVLADRATHHCT
jgi:hypothetical protein